MKKPITIILFLLIVACTYAQHAIVASGETNSNTVGSLSWTLGEVVTESGIIAPGQNSITQGFQQGDLSVLAIKEPLANTLNIRVLPNPATEYVNLVVDDYTNLTYKVSDLKGNIIANEKLQNNETRINLSYLSSGTFIVSVIKQNQELKSYKIIKK